MAAVLRRNTPGDVTLRAARMPPATTPLGLPTYPRAGRAPRPGANRRPRLELTRLTLPRRGYAQSHLDLVAEKVSCLDDRAAAAL